MKNIIVESIGSAKPTVSKILADAFKLPQEYFLKQIYNAPSLLFNNVSEELALQTEIILSELGLDIRVTDKIDNIDFNNPKGEISLYLEDVLDLPIVLEDMVDFLGSNHTEVFNLLVKEPAIIIGNVTEATAKALQKRTKAKVCFSIPKNDLYTVMLSKACDTNIKKEIEKFSNKRIGTINNSFYGIEDIEYKISKIIWKKYQSNKDITIINQSHQLVNISLKYFDLNNSSHTSFLTEKIGVPEELLKIIHTELPILIYEKIALKNANVIIEMCKNIGLDIDILKTYPEEYNIEISNISDKEKINDYLKVFYGSKDLVKTNKWSSPKALPFLPATYLSTQISRLNCNINIAV